MRLGVFFSENPRILADAKVLIILISTSNYTRLFSVNNVLIAKP